MYYLFVIAIILTILTLLLPLSSLFLLYLYNHHISESANISVSLITVLYLIHLFLYVNEQIHESVRYDNTLKLTLPW